MMSSAGETGEPSATFSVLRADPMPTDIVQDPPCDRCRAKGLLCVEQLGFDEEDEAKGKKKRTACYECARTKNGCNQHGQGARTGRKRKTPAVVEHSEEDELPEGEWPIPPTHGCLTDGEPETTSGPTPRPPSGKVSTAKPKSRQTPQAAHKAGEYNGVVAFTLLTSTLTAGVNALAKAAGDKTAAEVVAHQAEKREAEEKRRWAEDRAAELKQQRLKEAKKKARRQQAAEREKAAEEERKRAAQEERQRAAEAAQKAAHAAAQYKRTELTAAGKSSAGVAGMSERAAGKLPERATHPAQAQHQPQASGNPHDEEDGEADEEDGEADEEDGVRELNPTDEMESWLEVMDHAHKLGMPKWAQSLSLRLFELHRDHARMEDRINPQISKMTDRVDRVRGPLRRDRTPT